VFLYLHKNSSCLLKNLPFLSLTFTKSCIKVFDNKVSCPVSCPIGPRLHLLLQVGCIGFQFHSKHDKQGEYCFMNSVASKTPRKIKSLKCRTSFQFMNPPLFSSPNKKSFKSFKSINSLPIHKPETSNYFNSTHRLLLYCHIKNRSVDFTKQPKALSSSVHSSRRSPELHFPEW